MAPRPGVAEETFDFTDPAALDDPGWLAIRRLPAEVASVTGGRLSITGDGNTMADSHPRFIGRRQRHLNSTTSTRINGGTGGLAARYDEQRAELLDAALAYAAEYGFSELSWRPVAAALGVSPTTLVHHFGTKEQMLEAILGRLRERIFVATRDPAGEQADLATEARASWTRAFDPRHGAEFRLFFAVYGRALQAPQQFAAFLEHVVAYWMSALVDAQGPDTDPAIARRTATLVIATIRGLLLDLLATGDRDRIQDAAEHFLATLDPIARPSGARTR